MSQKNAYRSICARTASEGLKCKQWTVSSQKHSPAVSDDGLCLLIGGFGWFPEVDSVSVKIPPLHFGKLIWGKLPKNTQIFKSSGIHKADVENFNSFCPKLALEHMFIIQGFSLFREVATECMKCKIKRKYTGLEL